MNRLLFMTAFLLGAFAVIWMASGFVGSDALALSVTVVIGCAYTIGFIELLQFRQATATLSTALDTAAHQASEDIASLGQWLGKLHPSLQNSVRLRIEGERVGLPAPVITPYLVGLLVMLGLLGTFVGMVETLAGAVTALEGTTELQAIRAGLAAPINGLSLAFGTSVAGVAASAMLGLISTLSRRDRMIATGRLDTLIATDFRSFSLIHHRQETYKALQSQAQALPEVAARLEALADTLGHMGDQLGDKLLANQELFHAAVKQTYAELATSVDTSLRESLASSGRLAGESIKPLVEDAMAGISKEARATHQQLTVTAQEQLEGLSGHFTQTTAAVLESLDNSSASWLASQATGDKERLEYWSAAFGQAQSDAAAQLVEASRVFSDELKQVSDTQQGAMQSATEGFESMSGTLTTQWLQTSERMNEFTASLKNQVSQLRDDEERRAGAAVERLAGLESTVATHLASLGKALEEPMTRLIRIASETPRAAAEVIGQLRQEISNNIERDNKLLEDRGRLMTELNTLSDALRQASLDQRQAIEGLVSSSADLLQDVGSRFNTQVGSELARVSEVTDNFAGSTAQMSSLGDAFGLAVGLFSESNASLVENLNRIESSMDNATNRSDEQMGYYVAQAREIIDQSMLSHKEIFEELRQLGAGQDLVSAGAG